MIQNPHRLITKIPLRRLLQLRLLSSGKEPPPPPPPPPAKEEDGGGGGVISREEAYREIQNLDFMKATKILFTTPPKRKKFGFDFHLVQFFFACMPSLAVYLVAQYARHEIRRMEAEAELKKKKAEEEEAKAREEEKAKEAKLRNLEVGSSSDPALSKVIVRLDALEEVVKEIVDEKKKSDPQAKSSDPEVKSKASEPKPDLPKEIASGSSSSNGIPTDDGQKNKENGR